MRKLAHKISMKSGLKMPGEGQGLEQACGLGFVPPPLDPPPLDPPPLDPPPPLPLDPLDPLEPLDPSSAA